MPSLYSPASLYSLSRMADGWKMLHLDLESGRQGGFVDRERAGSGFLDREPEVGPPEGSPLTGFPQRS